MTKSLEAVLASFLVLSSSACAPEVVDSGGGGTGELGGADATTCGTSCSTTTSSCSTCTYCGYGSCSTSSCSYYSFCCSTPLLANFDGRPVTFVADDAHGFGLSATESIKTDWPTPATPWLALDRDGDGAIEDGGELFGSATRLADGRLARNGFEALAELDENHDGRIDAADPAFARIALWRDADGDRASSPGELEPAARSIVAIDLADHVEPRCDARGNCEMERAAMWFRDEHGELRRGAVIDVHLRKQR